MTTYKISRLYDLPLELQTRIFTLCQNPQIFLTSRHSYLLSKSNIVRATYLSIRYGSNVYSKSATQQKIYTSQVLRHLLKWKRPHGDDDFLTFAAQNLDLYTCQQIAQTLEMDQLKRWLSIAIRENSIHVIDLVLTMMPLDQRYVELACRLNQVQIVKHFVTQYGANIHVQDEKYLREACSNGYEEIVKYLLDDINETSSSSSSNNSSSTKSEKIHQGALVNAIYKQHIHIVKLLLSKEKVASNPSDLSVRYAIQLNNYDILKLLLEAGADPNCQQGVPLREACKRGMEKVVGLLLSFDADIEANQGGPMNEAISGGHLEVVKLLLANHASPSSMGARLGMEVAKRLNYHDVVNLISSYYPSL